MPLGERSGVHPERASAQEGHHSQVQDHIGHRIQQIGNPTYPELELVQQPVSPGKLCNFLLLLPKRPQNPHTGEILPGGRRHAIQPVLHLPVHGNRHQNDGKNHRQQYRNRHDKHRCPRDVNGKGHNHGAKHHKGGPKQQAQGQVYPVLQLVYIAGHASDHGRRAQGIYFPVGQPLKMGK